MPAQKLLVLGDLIDQIGERGFHGRHGVAAGTLRGHLPGRQAQIQRRASAPALLLLHECPQMHKVGLEDLQPALQFFDLMVKFAF